MRLEGYTDEEIKKWLWLRAVEWAGLPAYLSQLIAPILFVFWPWYFVVLGVIASGILWSFLRYSFVSVVISNAVVFLVVWLKWPAAIGSAIYLFIHYQPTAAVIALIWPLVAACTSLVPALFGFGPANILRIELALAKKLGIVSPEKLRVGNVERRAASMAQPAEIFRGERAVMKERTIVFGLLLLWALACGVNSLLGNPSASLKTFFFGFGDALVLVGVLYFIWNWVADRRTIHSRGTVRTIVFGLLLGWALLDAVMSAIEAPRVLEAPAWIGIVAFFLSLGWSLIFVVVLYLLWNWIAGYSAQRRVIAELSKDHGSFGQQKTGQRTRWAQKFAKFRPKW